MARLRTISLEDLEYLATGCAILGSGGGGDPSNEVWITRHAIDTYGAPSLLNPDALTSEDIVLPLAIMGAPLVAMEKLRSGREFIHLLDMVERTTGKRPNVLMPVEIGGANGFCALSIAGRLNLPVLDGDLMGRAFPQLQMTSCTVEGVSSSPTFLADSLGNTVRIEGNNAHALENIARHVTVSMGSSCAVAFALMDGEEAKRTIIPHTTSQAIRIGKVMAQAKKEGKDPIEALLDSAEGVRLGEGTISSVEQSIKKGFLEGSVTILGEDGTFKLFYQNEYLLAQKGDVALACTPDILMLLEKESGTPITTESLRYGLKVVLIALPAPAIWQTEKGLDLVGPNCFGYTINYKSIRRESCTRLA